MWEFWGGFALLESPSLLLVSVQNHLLLCLMYEYDVMVCQNSVKSPHPCSPLDLIVVVASIIVLAFGSKGQVFATSAVR